jgi:hypothetical protein
MSIEHEQTMQPSMKPKCANVDSQQKLRFKWSTILKFRYKGVGITNLPTTITSKIMKRTLYND